MGPAKDNMAEGRDRFQQGAFDRFHGIKAAEQRLVGSLPAEQSAYLAAPLQMTDASTTQPLAYRQPAGAGEPGGQAAQ